MASAKEMLAPNTSNEQLVHPAEHQLVSASERILEQGKQAAIDWTNHVLATNQSYRQYLEEQGLSPQPISTHEELQKLPPVDKQFLRGKTPLQLCPDIDDIYGISGSSGSTGEPVWIPRRKSADQGIYPAVSSIFADNWDTDTQPAVTVTSWALGMWVAGTLMVEIGNTMAKSTPESGNINHKLIAVHPGSNLKDTVNMIIQTKDLDQSIILQAYPPFAAEVLTALQQSGIDLTSLNLHLLVAGEPMSETWRIKIQQLLGGPEGEKDLSRVISLYGTAEGGVMGFETRLSILIRKMAHQNPKLRQLLFGSIESVPMLFQFPPQTKWIESVNGEIVFTGRTGIPSVRYNMHDRGGVITFADMMSLLHQQGYNPLQTLIDLGYGPKLKNIAPLPFVFVYGRHDGAVSIDGGNIYPADLDAFLLNPTTQALGIKDFSLGIIEENTQLHLVLHLQVNAGSSLNLSPETTSQLASLAAETIAANNADYRQSLQDNPQAAIPRIILHPHDDPLFSPNTLKMKRTRRC